MAKHKKTLLIFALIFLPFCLYAAGLKEAYNCGQAAQMLQINADAYHDPAPTVEDILAGVSPYMPLTRMEGCKMLLRAFGPLPDVQEGIRYLIKYRNCAFTDVPEDGREAVENLTNAGIYIPEDNTKFGPNQLMTEQELALLVDRIHAYLQSSPKDDFYSWATAELLNDPDFFSVPYNIRSFNDNIIDRAGQVKWIIKMLNDCLENPDTPEKKNIVAYLSTFMDDEGRENSMTFIQPMIDALWNAPDYHSFIDVCANICRETGIDILVQFPSWDAYKSVYYKDDDTRLVFSFGINCYSNYLDPDKYVPGEYEYESYLEQKTNLFSYLGFDMEEAVSAIKLYLEEIIRNGQLIYDSSTLPKGGRMIHLNTIPEELAIFPWGEYFKKAGYENDGSFYVNNYADMSISLSEYSKPENLPAVKVLTITNLLEAMQIILPLKIRDKVVGFWDDYYAADPSLIFDETNLLYYLMPLVQTDVYEYYSKTDECSVWKTYLENLCGQIITVYRQMLQDTDWIDEETKVRALEKLDAMRVEILIPDNMSEIFRAQYVSKEDGGTLFENVTGFLKQRRQWMYEQRNLSESSTNWSLWNCWINTPYYNRGGNYYCLTVSNFVSSHINMQSSIEEVMGYVGFVIGHEISHAFDYYGSYFNKDGDEKDWWTPEDRARFKDRTKNLASYMEGYEFFPGYSYTDGNQVLNESIADLTSMKCMMRIASQLPDFDYLKFFESFAKVFAVSATRRGVEYYLLPGVHAHGRLRINKLLSATDTFYTTLNIQEGDAMYVAPENRPHIW